MRRLAWWAIAATTAIGCSGGGKGGGSGPALVSIAVAPADPTTIVGGTVAFHATASYDDGSTRDVTPDATWTSTTVATATVSNLPGTKGVAAEVAPGGTRIRATLAGVAGETGLTVSAATVVSIRIDPSAAGVGVGATTALRCLGTTDVAGAPEVDLTGLAAWSSDLPDVASVSAGVAAGLKAGTAQLTATYQGLVAHATVTVDSAVLQGLALTLPAGAQLALGTQSRVDAIATYSDGSLRTVTGAATFASSAPGVLAFTTGWAGVYEAVGLGPATVTATFGGRAASVAVSVVPNEVVALVVDPSPTLLPQGDALPYRATALRRDGSAEDVTASAVWTSDAPQVATADGGLVTALSPGSAVVHASLAGVTGATVVRVADSPVNQLAINASSVSLVVGGTSEFTGTVWFAGPVYGSPSYSEPAADVVRAVVADPAVVALRRRASDGALLIAGLAAGSTTVTFSAGGISQVVTVQVVGGSLAVSVPSTFVPGAAASISATAVSSSGSLRADVSTLATWSTDAPTVAEVRVDARGYPTLAAHAAGTVHVTAQFAGATATAAVEVVPTPTSMDVSPPSFALGPRATQRLTVLGHLPGRDVDLTAIASWLVEDPTVGYVYGGTFTASRAGTSAVVATVAGLSARSSAVVWPDVPTSITLLPALANGAAGPYVLGAGELAVFSAVPYFPYAYGGEAPVVPIGWTSADPAVADFSPSRPGELTAVAAGTTTITASYTHPSGAVVAAHATVQVAPLRGLAAAQPVSVLPAESKVLPVTGTFDDGSGTGATFTGDVTPWVSWTSSAPDVARPYPVARLTGAVVSTTPGVLGIAAGGAVLTGTLASSSVDVAVVGLPPAISSVAISYASPGVVGASFAPTASAVIVPNAFALDVTDVAAWAGDGAVLGVSGAPPVVQLLSAGTAPLTATVQGVTGTSSVAVSSETFYALVPAERRLTLVPGGAAYVDSRAYRQSYSGFAVGAQASAASSDAAVATATPTSSGVLVQAHAPGEALVTVSYAGRDERFAVNVFELPGSPWLWSQVTRPLHVHERGYLSLQQSASAIGLSLTATGMATWTSSDPTTVRVVSPGVVEGVKPGRAVITAATPTWTAPVAVTVSDATVASVSPSMPTLPMPVGAAYPLRAYARYSDGAYAEVTPLVTWWSATPATAAFDAAQPNRVRALAPGTTRVECRLDGLSGYAIVTGF